MPRIAPNGFSIGQLENLLITRRSQIRKLEKKRARVAKQLALVDRQINDLGGGTGVRARNSESLVEMLKAVLDNAGKPMKVGDITAAVQKRGYHSNSANFRAIVNQTLIKEKQFIQASRGIYKIRT